MVEPERSPDGFHLDGELASWATLWHTGPQALKDFPCNITILKSLIHCTQLTLVFIFHWALQMIQLVLIPADSHGYLGAGKTAVS